MMICISICVNFLGLITEPFPTNWIASTIAFLGAFIVCIIGDRINSKRDSKDARIEMYFSQGGIDVSCSIDTETFSPEKLANLTETMRDITNKLQKDSKKEE